MQQKIERGEVLESWSKDNFPIGLDKNFEPFPSPVRTRSRGVTRTPSGECPGVDSRRGGLGRVISCGSSSCRGCVRSGVRGAAAFWAFSAALSAAGNRRAGARPGRPPVRCGRARLLPVRAGNFRFATNG